MKSKEIKLLDEWKKRLGLFDWRIQLELNCKPNEMALEDCAGCVIFKESIKDATIQMVDPTYCEFLKIPYDFEKVLIHELLHLKLALVCDNTSDLQERYMHQVIEDFARAFVDAKRQELKKTEISLER